MKALLLADFYQAKKHCRMFIVMILVFIGVGITQSSFFALYFPSAAMIFAGIIAMTLIAYDEQSHWDMYAQTLPFTRQQIVSVKYLDALIFIGIVWVLLMVMLFIKAATGGIQWSTLPVLAPVYIGVGLLSPSLLLPVVFRYGMAKGRIVYIALVIIISSSGGILNSLGLITEKNFHIPDVTHFAIPFIFMAVAAALFALSWKLAIRWYEKREL